MERLNGQGRQIVIEYGPDICCKIRLEDFFYKPNGDNVIVQLNMGEIVPQQDAADAGQEAPAQLERDVMLVYTGKFNSMDGEVEITDEHIETLAANHNSMFSKLGRLVGGQPNLKIAPPIQLDHSTSAKDTVGRLVGEVKVGSHQVDGKSLKALLGRAKFLGKENVQKVMDGRWTHVSIGADLEAGKIQELTITPFPAAADASLLKKGVSVEHKGKKATIVDDGEIWEIQDKDGNRVGQAKSLEEAKSLFKKIVEQNMVDLSKLKRLADINYKDFKIELYDGEDGYWHWVVGDGHGQGRANSESEAKAQAQKWVDKFIKENQGKLSRMAKPKPGAKQVDGKWVPTIDGVEDDSAGTFKSMKEATDWAREFIENHPEELKKMSRLSAPEVYKDRGHECEVGCLENGSYYFSVEGVKSDGFKDLADAKAKCKEKVDIIVKEKELADGKSKKLSEGGKSMDKEKMKKHLMEHHKMSADDADKKMASMSDDDMKNLSAEVDEHEKKMAADKPEAKMAAAKAKITELCGLVNNTHSSIKLAQKKVEINSRLSKLKAEGRITPAEVKKIDIVKLASESQATVDAVFKAYEVLEPRIIPGLMGSAKAEELSKLGGAARMSELERETRMNMSSRRNSLKESEAKDKSGVELKGRVKGYRFADGETEIHIDTTPHAHYDMSHYEKMCQMMDEGKGEEVKSEMKKLYEHLKKMGLPSDPMGEDQHAQMSTLALEVEKLQNHTKELAKLVETVQ